jgi:glycerophosphoryl diester phosphodiesterase
VARVVRVLGYAGLALLLFVLGVLAFNASIFEAPHRDEPPRIIAHRGVAQTFDKAGVTNDTCTATRIHAPAHAYIENTLPSMAAAFAAGADVVELDVHLTPDGQFAVMHDWTLDCRTNGAGVTHETPMSVLKTLDVGYGYTADGGKTFPLRGQGVGMMPTLPEVLERFPDGRFLVNFKSNFPEDGEEFARLLSSRPDWRETVWGVYGGGRPTEAAITRVDGLRGYHGGSLMDCALDYELTGWTGVVPKSCRNTIVLVPSNFAWLVWGWPHKFTRRMEKAGSEVILVGPVEGRDIGTTGLDALEDLDTVPRGFGGYVWTNRVEVIAPALRARP